MTIHLRLLLFCAIGALPVSTALADARAGQWYLTGMASYVDDDPDRVVDDVVGGMAGFGKAVHDNINIEFYGSYASPGGPNAQDQLGAGLDLQVVFGRANRLTPYLFLGVGYLEVDPDTGESEQGPSYGAGVGLLADIFGSSPVALRLEYRYRRDDVLDLDDPLGDQIVSLGLQVPLGAREAAVAAAAVEPDSDGDGVPDSRDECPQTSAGVQVDASGCEPDADADGVADRRDDCPGTPYGMPVDARGCERDSDGDGVVDSSDRCAGTPPGRQVDVHGCEIREQIDLPNVNFQTNSDRLLPGAEATLDEVAETLNRNPGIRFEIEGHTDGDGATDYNESLSQRRAETVRDYLIAKGVRGERMTARGYGESQPIADNATPEGKAQNRRVVLRVTER